MIKINGKLFYKIFWSTQNDLRNIVLTSVYITGPKYFVLIHISCYSKFGINWNSRWNRLHLQEKWNSQNILVRSFYFQVPVSHTLWVRIKKRKSECGLHPCFKWTCFLVAFLSLFSNASFVFTFQLSCKFQCGNKVIPA